MEEKLKCTPYSQKRKIMQNFDNEFLENKKKNANDPIFLIK